MEFKSWLEQYQDRLAAVEAEMQSCLPAASDLVVDPFYGMMSYHLGWLDANLDPSNERTGKRLRPLLCLLACEVASGDWQSALPAAAAVELLHNFTLIHDDIEDNSPLRRGRPTVWNLWGVPHGINTGDGLFVLARNALLRLRQRGLPDALVLQAVQAFDWSVLRICEGQYLDLSFEGRLDVDEQAYTGMIARKTAALLEVAVQIGGLVGRLDAAGVGFLRQFGHALGLAFQVQDDILGVWGEETQTGKPAAADVYGRKLGFPVVHALGQAGIKDRTILEVVFQGTRAVAESDVQAVLGVLKRTGSQHYAAARAAAYHAQALRALESLPPIPARAALEEMSNALLDRRS